MAINLGRQRHQQDAATGTCDMHLHAGVPSSPRLSPTTAVPEHVQGGQGLFSFKICFPHVATTIDSGFGQ